MKMGSKTKDTAGQTEHFKASASGYASWSRCPASASVCETTESHINTRVGTFIHDIGEEMLLQKGATYYKVGMVIPSKYNIDEKEVPAVTHNMLNQAKNYYEYCLELTEGNLPELIDSKHVGIEVRLNLSTLYKGAFGTGDFAYYDEDNHILHIVDLKTGFGAVSVTNNRQLQIYAIGFIKWLEKYHEFEVSSLEVVLHIVQNNMIVGDNTNSFTTNYDELKLIVPEIKSAYKGVFVDDPNCVAGAIQCKWCDGKINCPTFFTYFEKLIKDIVADAKSTAQLAKHLTKIPSDRMADIYLAKQLMTSGFEIIEKELLDRMNIKGEKVDKLKLIETSGRANWSNEDELVKKLKKFGIKEDDMFDKKILSPNQVFQKLDLDKEQIEQILTLRQVPKGRIKIDAKSSTKKEYKAIVNQFDDFG